MGSSRGSWPEGVAPSGGKGAESGAPPSKRVSCARALCATSCCRCSSSMRFCNSAILVSLTSRGGATGAADDMDRVGCGFLPPVSHMIATMRNARPTRSQDCTFLGRSPSGLGALSCTCGVSTIARASVRGHAPREGELSLADGEIAHVDNLRCDVHAVLELERD